MICNDQIVKYRIEIRWEKIEGNYKWDFGH